MSEVNRMCLLCGEWLPEKDIPAHSSRCKGRHESAQDAMNRQHEEIKQSIEEAALCLIKSSVNAGLNHDDEMNALRNSVCSIIKILAKMNGVEDALK